MFSVSSPHGFHIGFENGFSLSVQFGGGNYGSNYDEDVLPKTKEPFRKAEKAEIAVLKNGNLYDWEHGDTVEGHVSTQNVAKILFYISNLSEDFNQKLDWNKMLSSMIFQVEELILKEI
jgi:hypothetical protein